MNERFCWNCGHPQASHTREGGCSFGRDANACDCPVYEDSQYLGEQRKRDTYTYSDRRRLGQGRAAR